MSKKQVTKPHGFSLIELLIVVVIIGIVAAIAIPNFLAARRSANEGSAIADLRLVHGAQMTYATSKGFGNFAGNSGGTVTVDPFGQLAAEGLIDTSLGSGTKSGYNFSGGKIDLTDTNPASFCLRAVPILGTGPFATGPRNVAVSTVGVMFAGDAAIAAAAACTVADANIAVTGADPLGN